MKRLHKGANPRQLCTKQTTPDASRKDPQRFRPRLARSTVPLVSFVKSASVFIRTTIHKNFLSMRKFFVRVQNQAFRPPFSIFYPLLPRWVHPWLRKFPPLHPRLRGEFRGSVRILGPFKDWDSSYKQSPLDVLCAEFGIGCFDFADDVLGFDASAAEFLDLLHSEWILRRWLI
jgi:hypothetical protein